VNYPFNTQGVFGEKKNLILLAIVIVMQTPIIEEINKLEF